MTKPQVKTCISLFTLLTLLLSSIGGAPLFWGGDVAEAANPLKKIKVAWTKGRKQAHHQNVRNNDRTQMKTSDRLHRDKIRLLTRDRLLAPSFWGGLALLFTTAYTVELANKKHLYNLINEAVYIDQLIIGASMGVAGGVAAGLAAWATHRKVKKWNLTDRSDREDIPLAFGQLFPYVK